MRKKDVLKYQIELYDQYLEELHITQTEIRKNEHDFHNYLLTIREQLTHGDVESVLAYINELNEKLDSMQLVPQTGNVSLDATLATKIARAKAEDIAVIVNAYVPVALTIFTTELSIAISILLDTAIEACCAIPMSSDNMVKTERFIFIDICLKGKMLYFSMKCSVWQKKKKFFPSFCSEKNFINIRKIQVAEKILDKMGWINYNNEEGIFILEFLVPTID